MGKNVCLRSAFSHFIELSGLNRSRHVSEIFYVGSINDKKNSRKVQIWDEKKMKMSWSFHWAFFGFSQKSLENLSQRTFFMWWNFFLCSTENLCEDSLFALSHLLLSYLCTSFALLHIKHKRTFWAFLRLFHSLSEVKMQKYLSETDYHDSLSSDVETMTMTMKNSEESFDTSFNCDESQPSQNFLIDQNIWIRGIISCWILKWTNLGELKLINNSTSVPYDVTRTKKKKNSNSTQLYRAVDSYTQFVCVSWIQNR